MAPERVAQAPSAHEVDLAAKDLLQIVLHLHEVEEAQPGLRGECDQDVDVTLRREVLPQDRAEESELVDVPFTAEDVESFERQGQLCLGRGLEGHGRKPSVR